MSLGKDSVLSKQESEETCESMPRNVPKKIEQETVKLNYQGLVAIPKIKLPQIIRRLYLSHNKIASLQGIEAFTALQSINFSYNCLQRVQQLRKISRPEILKHLKIRMNQLPYGYQDYAIAIFPSLQSFEDLKLNKQTKEAHFILRQFVSKNLLEFLRRMQSVVEFLNRCELDKENNMNRHNCGRQVQYEVNKKESIIKGLVTKLHRLYHFPTHQTLANMSVTNLLTVAAEIIRTVSETSISFIPLSQHHLEVNQRIFRNLFESILLKMSARHDKTLAEYLQSLQESNPALEKIEAFRRLGIFQEDQEPKIEARIVAGCLKSPLLTENPAKYLQKLSAKSLKEHPMNKLIEWRDPQKRSLLEMEETKWHDFYRTRSREGVEVVDQQIPLFIYCKQYLEVITEIILDQSSLLLQQSHQQTSKTCLISKALSQEVEEEIELQLSMSDGISFGAKEGNDFKDAPALCTSTLGHHDNRSYDQETKPKFKQCFQDNYYLNIQSYSLHQINLAYKVFRALKARVKRSKNRSHHYN